MTLNEWAETCIAVYKPNLKKGTMYHYSFFSRLNNCILRHLGEMDLDEIKPIDCQRCLNYQIGKSRFHIREVHQMMNFLFERAIENDLIIKNPARKINRPGGPVGTRRSLTNEERRAFLKELEDPANLPFAFMYYCGLRPSEARNIFRDDIMEIGGVPALHIRGTKTKNAVRDVPLPDELSRLIRFDDPKICVMSYETLSRRWQVLRKKMGAAPDLVPYCLRHTYCTDLQKIGVDVRIAQKLMGHSSINLTSTIYSHVDADLFTITFSKINERQNAVNP